MYIYKENTLFELKCHSLIELTLLADFLFSYTRIWI